ncbi:MAG: efflux RND transporter periplasmic adaptor subunit [Planctomycetota bacterium]
MKRSVGVVLAGTLLLCGCPAAQPPAAAGAQVAPRTKVGARGRLSPASRLRRVAGPPGERLGRLAVDELDAVQQGQLLATLENHDELRVARDLARSNLLVAQRQLQTVTEQGQRRIRVAELQLAQLERVGPLRIRAMEDECRRRQALVAQHQADLSRMENLLQTGVSQEGDVERQRHIVAQVTYSLAGGKVELEQLRQQQATDLELARATIALRKAEVQREQEALQVAALQTALELAEARLARTTIEAPCAGRVLRLLARPGELLSDGAILTLADLSTMIAVVEVYESDVRYVRLGQRARLTSPALPRELTGRVTRVGQLVARNQVYDLEPAADADVRVVEVEVTLDQSEVAASFVSLQVDVSIELGDAGGGGAAPVGSSAAPPAPGASPAGR